MVETTIDSTSGINTHSVPSNRIRSTWQQSKPSLGLLIITVCSSAEVELPIAASASGTRSPDSRCNVLTQVRSFKALPDIRWIIKRFFFFLLLGSQVCNLAWSKHSSELVSTHGYSQNQILVWKYPSLTQVAKLTGHSYRVLYLALSPDGEAIVTGAGDETLRFWNVFSKARSQKENKSVLNLFTNIR